MTVVSNQNSSDAQPEKTWLILAMSGDVRAKFLEWTPEDVLEIDSPQLLATLYAFYTPSSHPDANLSECCYCEEMLEAITIRIHYV